MREKKEGYSMVQRVTIRGIASVQFVHLQGATKIHLTRIVADATFCGRAFSEGQSGLYWLLNDRWMTDEDVCQQCQKHAGNGIILTPYAEEDRQHDQKAAADMMQQILGSQQEG